MDNAERVIEQFQKIRFDEIIMMNLRSKKILIQRMVLVRKSTLS